MSNGGGCRRAWLPEADFDLAPSARFGGLRNARAIKASYERSDVCVVPAAGVAGEAMVALTIARLALEKFGGDQPRELKRNFDGYCEQFRNF